MQKPLHAPYSVLVIYSFNQQKTENIDWVIILRQALLDVRV